MKKTLSGILILSGIIMHAQTTVVEEKFENDNVPVGYNFLPVSNKIIIQKGKHVSASTNRMIKNLFSYDSNSKKEILLQNNEVMYCDFSDTENSFKAVNYQSVSVPGKEYHFFTKEGKSLTFKNEGKLIRETDMSLFNDKYNFNFVNQKNDEDIDLQKDDLILNITDIFNGENRKIKLEKPDVSRLVTNGPAGYYHIALIYKANKDNFEIITKAWKDPRSSVLYRTIYDYEGKKINDCSYPVQLKNSDLNYNYPQFINSEIADNASRPSKFRKDLPINKFYIDEKTGEVYIYGLCGNMKLERYSGYYVFKFNKSGEKIWESIVPINDTDYFNAVDSSLKPLQIDLKVKGKEVIVYAFPNPIAKDKLLNYKGKFLNYSVIDNASGKNLKTWKIEYNEKNNFNSLLNKVNKDFLPSTYINGDYGNKFFDLNGLLLLDKEIKISDYVSGINNKEKLFFSTEIADDGIWLLESDNKTYYKVLFFKA